MAVYTEVGDEELIDFIGEYEIGDVVSCKGIAEGVENTNYLLHTGSGSYILTLYEKRVNAGDLPFFLGLMEHLAREGVDCPVPVHGKDGRALREISGRPAALTSFLEGMWPRRIKAEHCAEVGTALARMHIAGSRFDMVRPNSLSVDAWKPLFAKCAARADEVATGLAPVIENELEYLTAHWPKNLPAGVCHADLFPDNVFFIGDKLSGLIDFYFACNDYFAYDLAICLNAWCFERDNSFNVTKAQLLLSNYRKVRSFSDDEVQALPLLARGSAMRFLLTRLYDWLHHPEGALVKPKDPLDYLTKLKFHQQAQSAGAYGLE